MAGKKPVRKKVSKKASTKSLSLIAKYWQNYRTMIILVALAVIFIGYWIIAQELPKRAEKRDLIQKHQKLEEIASEIVATYPTAGRKSERNCGYTSAKFEKGTLSCSVYIDLAYAGKSIDEANVIKNNLTKKFDLKLNNSGIFEANGEDFELLSNGELVNSFNSKLSGSLEGCTLGYVYNPDKSLEIRLSCFVSPSKAEHFPLKK